MNVFLVLSILLIHWFADFVCQSDKQAKGKSTSLDILAEHVFVYTCIWIIPVLVYGIVFAIPTTLMWFLPITFCCHFVTDMYTSRLNKQLLVDYPDSHKPFFVAVGFDQFLHYVQLLLTAYYLLHS